MDGCLTMPLPRRERSLAKMLQCGKTDTRPRQFQTPRTVRGPSSTWVPWPMPMPDTEQPEDDGLRQATEQGGPQERQQVRTPRTAGEQADHQTAADRKQPQGEDRAERVGGDEAVEPRQPATQQAAAGPSRVRSRGPRTRSARHPARVARVVSSGAPHQAVGEAAGEAHRLARQADRTHHGSDRQGRSACPRGRAAVRHLAATRGSGPAGHRSRMPAS